MAVLTTARHRPDRRFTIVTTQLYRFRSTKHLHDELREQQIYFAKPHELNDPMEGFRDIVWKGDEIVWTNFFRHYIACLHLTVVLAVLNGETFAITPAEIPIEGLADDHQSTLETNIVDELCTNVFQRCRLPRLIHELASSNHAARRDEVLIYLKYIHYVILEEIQHTHARHKLSSGEAPANPRFDLRHAPSKLPVLIRRLYEEHPDIAQSAVSTLFSTSNRIFDNINLLRKYDLYKQHQVENVSASNHNLILLDFPKIYLSQLTRILYPEWYVACFLEDCRNSSLWGHYGENHKGACLIFNVADTSGQHALPLRRIVGFSGQRDAVTGTMKGDLTWDLQPVSFYKIRYEAQVGDLDFFRSIGVLPTGKLVSKWYTDQSGARSECGSHVGTEENERWRLDYWRKFYRDITIKTKDWEYEREVRLILSSSLVDLSDTGRRKLQYEFNSLKGIIFGINMSDEDKIAIIDIVRDKCLKAKRETFEFWQAHFSPESKGIERQQLDIRV